MIKVLEGQISFGGMQDALESVARHTHVKYGLVRVTSNACSGLIGVFCGRVITGALITLSGETGVPALEKLLTAKDGSFALLDVSKEPLPDVNQSLSIDLQALLSTQTLSLDAMPISEQSLTTGTASRDSIPVIDTAAETEKPELTAERINQTYQRIVALSQHLKAQTLDTGPPPSQDEDGALPSEQKGQPEVLSEVLTDEMFYDEDPQSQRRGNQWDMAEPVEVSTLESLTKPHVRETIVSETGNQFAVIFDGAASGPAPKLKSTDEYKRLKDWGDKSLLFRRILWLLVIAGMGYAVYYYSADIAKIVGTVMAHLAKHK